MKNTYEYQKERAKFVSPSMSFDGGDYEAWKGLAREKLHDLLGMDKYVCPHTPATIEYDVQQEGFREIRFLMETEEGYFVPCHLWLPDGIEHPPVIICLQGHSPGMHISMARLKSPNEARLIENGDRDFCVRAVKEGFAAVALEQRNFGELQGEGKCLDSSLTALLYGRTTIGERVHDVKVCIDTLEKQFADLVDTEKICCMGNSGGGTATAYVAALEDRIKLAVPSCAMCTYKDSIVDLEHCSCNYVPRIAEFFDMGDLMAMAAPKAFIQVSGLEDNIFPIDAAKSVFEKGSLAYEQLGVKDRTALVIGNGGHRFYADDTWPLIHKILGC
ncbi:MAG: acetylxylan esterase [Clostridia bacterium]|nr:acetylxylan esterase [Clostridia bacterium]